MRIVGHVCAVERCLGSFLWVDQSMPKGFPILRKSEISAYCEESIRVFFEKAERFPQRPGSLQS
jgi:hypothetical protein